MEYCNSYVFLLNNSYLGNMYDLCILFLVYLHYMYNKQKTLHEQGLGTEIEFEQAKNQKKSLESKLKTLQSQKGKTIVSAPFSGSIDQIFTHLGEMASPQAPLIRLVNNKNIRITANVSENHLICRN